MVGGAKLFDGVLGAVWRQQVGREHHVVAQVAQLAAVGQRPAVEPLAVEHQLGIWRTKQLAQAFFFAVQQHQLFAGSHCQRVDAVLVLCVPLCADAQRRLFARLLEQLLEREGTQLRRFLRLLLLRRRCIGAGQSQALDDAGHSQTGEQLEGLLLLDRLWQKVFRGAVERHIAVDGGKRLAQKGALSACFQLCLDRFGRVDLFKVGIDGFDVAVLADQLEGGFFADACHARDVVRAVAHQRLDVDEVGRRGAVLLLKISLVTEHRLGFAHAGACQQHGGVLADQLQAVAVAGGDETLVALLLAFCREGAQDVVGLVSFHRDDAIAQILQQLLDERQLLGQLLGHSFALGLVAVVHLVAEGRRLQVKGAGDGIGLDVAQQLVQNIHKAIDGVGIGSVLGGQQFDPIKGAV